MCRALRLAPLLFGAATLVAGCGNSSNPLASPSIDAASGAAPDGSSVADAGNDSAAPSTGCINDGDPFAVAALRDRVSFFASTALAGRGPGTAADRAARAAIEERFRCLGLTAGADGGGYEQAFVDDAGNSTANLVGFVQGTDPVVGAEVVVIGAHHDHLGVARGVVYPGANDNASGITALLAVAQAIQAGPNKPRRTIAFVAFGAEESGFEGSTFYVAHPPRALPLARVVYMINLDMVGSHSVENTVYALGSFADTPARALLVQEGRVHPTISLSLGEPGDSSDHMPFCGRAIPYVFFWTPGGSCYHESCDTADRIDYAPMSEIARVVAGLTRGLADSTVDLAAQRRTQGFTCNGSARRELTPDRRRGPRQNPTEQHNPSRLRASHAAPRHD